MRKVKTTWGKPEKVYITKKEFPRSTRNAFPSFKKRGAHYNENENGFTVECF